MNSIIFICDDPRIGTVKDFIQPLILGKITIVPDFDAGIPVIFNKNPGIVFLQHEINGVKAGTVARHVRSLLQQNTPNLFLLDIPGTRIKDKVYFDASVNLLHSDEHLLNECIELIKTAPNIRWKHAAMIPSKTGTDLTETAFNGRFDVFADEREEPDPLSPGEMTPDNDSKESTGCDDPATQLPELFAGHPPNESMSPGSHDCATVETAGVQPVCSEQEVVPAPEVTDTNTLLQGDMYDGSFSNLLHSPAPEHQFERLHINDSLEASCFENAQPGSEMKSLLPPSQPVLLSFSANGRNNDASVSPAPVGTESVTPSRGSKDFKHKRKSATSPISGPQGLANRIVHGIVICLAVGILSSLAAVLISHHDKVNGAAEVVVTVCHTIFSTLTK